MQINKDENKYEREKLIWEVNEYGLDYDTEAYDKVTNMVNDSI